jgi:hypothetical protein
MEKAWTKSLDTHLQQKAAEAKKPGKAWTPICSRKPQKKSLLKKSLKG